MDTFMDSCNYSFMDPSKVSIDQLMDSLYRGAYGWINVETVVDLSIPSNYSLIHSFPQLTPLLNVFAPLTIKKPHTHLPQLIFPSIGPTSPTAVNPHSLSAFLFCPICPIFDLWFAHVELQRKALRV